MTLLTEFTHAQTDDFPKTNMGVYINSSISGVYNFVTLNPGFSISKKRHTFGIGPILILATNFFDTLRNGGFKLSGLHGIYQFHPSKYDRILNFYFQYDILYQNVNDSCIMHKKSNYHSIEQYIGYGLKVNLSDNIYIKQNVGYGLIFSHLFVTRTEYDWIVNLSLGVTFK